jgi:nucleotide-binding universal stress UspA family protein
MSRILVAVSSPWAAQKCVEPMSDLAKRLGAEVLVIHVSRPSAGQMREQEQADGESAINILREKLAERGITVQTLLLFSDDIARAVLNTAIERQASLIVLGRECPSGVDQEHEDSGAAASAGLERGDLRSEPDRSPVGAIDDSPWRKPWVEDRERGDSPVGA